MAAAACGGGGGDAQDGDELNHQGKARHAPRM